MEHKIFDALPVEAARIRTEVFIEEQGFSQEFDETDKTARHIVLFDGGSPVAVCRIYRISPHQEAHEGIPKAKSEPADCLAIGRIAVKKQYRGQSVGSLLLRLAEMEIAKMGTASAILHAQCRAREFYEKQGYQAYGEMDYEEGCPHIWMRKSF